MKRRIQSKDGSKVVELNRRKAIRERCLNCCCWSAKEVQNCSHEDDCTLFTFRSGVGKQDAKARSKAIRAYCYWCCAFQRPEVSKCQIKDCSLWSYRLAKVDTSAKIDPI